MRAEEKRSRSGGEVGERGAHKKFDELSDGVARPSRALSFSLPLLMTYRFFISLMEDLNGGGPEKEVKRMKASI